MPPTAPQIVGRYAIHARIAAGGMASVHFARFVGPAGFARTVAVKRAHPHLAHDDDFALMFLDEARLAARIQHPNVVTTLDVLQTSGELLLVMEYVHGESLWRLVRAAEAKGERVPLGIAASIIVDALHGLHAAHEAKDERGEPLHLVHRDVSPHNILVGADGVSRIVDFGIAKAAGRLHSTRDSSVKGKYAYMAPEQARGEQVSRLTDTYAAAIVFWELLTGERLFAGKTEAETIHKSLVARVRRPSMLVPGLAPALDAILQKGLSRALEGRYATAREMALDIEACVPAVRPSEVGAWVRLMSAAALAERAQVLAALEALPPGSLEEAPPSVPAAAASVMQAASRRPASRSHATFGWFAAVAAGLALASTATLLLRHSAAPAADGPQATAPLASASVAVAASSPSALASVVGPVPAPSASIAATAAAHPSHPVKPSAAARASRAAHALNCDPPYSIDSAGRQIFKPECVR